jgi:hypothetical protein
MIAAPDFLIRAGELDFFRNRDFRLTQDMHAPDLLPVRLTDQSETYCCAYRAQPSKSDGSPMTDLAGRTLYHAFGALVDKPEISQELAVALCERVEELLEPMLLEFLGHRLAPGHVSATSAISLSTWEPKAK